jgi:hypothetical protein
MDHCISGRVDLCHILCIKVITALHCIPIKTLHWHVLSLKVQGQPAQCCHLLPSHLPVQEGAEALPGDACCSHHNAEPLARAGAAD